MDGGKFVLAAFSFLVPTQQHPSVPSLPQPTEPKGLREKEMVASRRRWLFNFASPCRPLLNIPTNTCQAQQLFRLPFSMNQRASVGYDALMLLSVDQS